MSFALYDEQHLLYLIFRVPRLHEHVSLFHIWMCHEDNAMNIQIYLVLYDYFF